MLDQPGIEAKPTPPVSGPDPGGVVNTCDYTLSTDGGDEPVFFLTVFAKAGKANAALAFLRQYSGSTEGKDLKQISGLGTAAVSYTSTIAGQVVNGEKIPASQSFDVVFARSSGKDAVGFDCGAVAGSLTNPPASLLNLAKRVAATLPQP